MGDDGVYVKGNSSSRGGELTLHPDPDCPRLEEANSVYGPKDPSVYPDDAVICRHCGPDDVNYHRNGPGGIWQSLEDAHPDDVTAR